LRRGLNRLSGQQISGEVVLNQGYPICQKAYKRFGRSEFIPAEVDFRRRVSAAIKHPKTVEFTGVYKGSELVAFSENHIQDGGVFAESIWFDPDYLGDYAGYVHTWALLEHYLTARKMKYVTDGSRSLYHASNIQHFLQEKFLFKKRFAALNIEYSNWLKLYFAIARPFSPMIGSMSKRTHLRLLKMATAMSLQDQIALACLAYQGRHTAYQSNEF
jgi:hypothetical protein